MLTSLRIRNLKALEDTEELAIKPLTLLIGPNSAGKSTVLQALLMMKQTVDSRDLRNPLSINGPWVEMGSFRDLIRGRNIDNTLGIDLTFAAPDFTESLMEVLIPSAISFSSEIDSRASGRRLITSANFKETRDGRISSQRFVFEYKWDESDYARGPEPHGSVVLREDEKAYLCRASVPAKEGQAGSLDHHVWSRPEAKFYSLIPEELGDSNTVWPRAIMQSFSYDFERSFSAFSYLGPLRARPKRVYSVTGETPQDVGHTGEKFADVLLSAGSRRLESKLSEWLSKFEVAAEFKLRQMEQSFFFVELRNPLSGVTVNLADSGFGSSQVIPIIVEGFFAQEGALMLFEQPEIHLHPRAQGVLGDLLVDIASEGRRLIVETHSEHMLGRIQSNIAEGNITKEDVGVYYFQPNVTGTRVHELVLDGNGQFETEGLPEDFFAQGYNESLRQMDAIAKKMRNDSSGR